ncbi:ABC transporter substrate-binding protein, partial [Chloroflexota bacterium]
NVLEKWEIAPDGLSWVLYVREGIKFHDGSDLTAKDVKFSIEQYMRPEAFLRNLGRSVDHVNQEGEYIVRVFTQGQVPLFPYLLTGFAQNQGLVMPKNYTELNGYDYLVEHPMGSGPWEFSKHVSGDRVEYTAVKNHWRQTPSFENLIIMLVPEESTRVAMLKAGDADIINVSTQSGVELDQDGYTIESMLLIQPRLHFSGILDPRAAGRPVTDIKVREALQIAINQNEIADALFYGKSIDPMPARVLYGLPELDSDYWTEYLKKSMAYDPERAKELLAEAGYPNGFSGLTMFVTEQTGMEYVNDLAVIVQQYWKAVGINADIVPMDSATYSEVRREPKDMIVGHASFGITGAFAPAVLLMSGLFSSQGSGPLVSRRVPDGEIEIYTPELEALLTAYQVEPDQAKREEILAEAIKVTVDLRVTIPFGQVPASMAVGPMVKFDPADLKQPLTTAAAATWAAVAQHK